MRERVASLAGSALFLLVAPGTVAVYIPWLIGRWRFAAELGASAVLRGAGLALIILGAAALLECFLRFAWRGVGTPAPILPTRHLVVSGLYRHGRNPMYVAVSALIFGQALYFGDTALAAYGACIWAAFHLFVLLYEEPALGRQFPREYRDYRSAVPRWLPRLRPWRSAA
jgi:protein-S-isoprenylcysteine O-methyltransferase Ste14